MRPEAMTGMKVQVIGRSMMVESVRGGRIFLDGGLTSM